MDIPILYEDESVVVIDKPSGVICNRAETVMTETIQDWMDIRYQMQDLRFKNVDEDTRYFQERSGLVHRLDKETSGVMVLAKTPEAFIELLRQFREREVVKTYVALTHGIWKSKDGTISLPIGRRRDDRQKFGVREDGRESVTGYKVLSEWVSWKFPKELHVDDRGYSGFSLVQFMPKTGRTHQIRVHARFVGHPVVGDMQYAGRKRSREDRKWSKHVMLLARSIEFTRPAPRGERVHFETKQDLLREAGEYFPRG